MGCRPLHFVHNRLSAVHDPELEPSIRFILYTIAPYCVQIEVSRGDYHFRLYTIALAIPSSAIPLVRPLHFVHNRHSFKLVPEPYPPTYFNLYTITPIVYGLKSIWCRPLHFVHNRLPTAHGSEPYPPIHFILYTIAPLLCTDWSHIFTSPLHFVHNSSAKLLEMGSMSDVRYAKEAINSVILA